MAPVTRLFLDSRFAISRSQLGGVCSFEIDGGIELRPEARCFLGDLTAVVAWNTVDSSNSILYMQENGQTRGVFLSHGAHDINSIAADIETKLNEPAGKDPGMGTYSVNRVGSGSGGSSFQHLQVSCTAGVFTIPDNAAIEQIFGVTNPPTTNSLFSFPLGNVAANSQTSSFVDLRRSHSIFVHSPSFGAYNSIGPRGTRTIMAKVPVDVAYGGLVQWKGGISEHDFTEIGVRSLNVLTLELRDTSGLELDLDGTHWSCTLLFER